jgi:hypothetical protein
MSKFYERSKLESSDVQGPAIVFAKMRGWFIEAIQSKSRNGFPDTFCARKGRIVLCEFKAPGEEPTAQQLLRHQQLREQGVEVVWFDNLEDAKAFFR